MKWIFSFFTNFRKDKKSSLSTFTEGERAYEKAKKLFHIENQPSEALFYFDLALQHDIVETFVDRAFCLQSLEYHHDAISDFNKAVSLFRNDPNIYYGRGHSRKIIMDYDGAIEDLQNAVDLAKQNSSVNDSYNKTMQEQGWGSASQFYQFQLGDALKRKKELKGALHLVYTKIAKEVKRRPSKLQT